MLVLALLAVGCGGDGTSSSTADGGADAGADAAPDGGGGGGGCPTDAEWDPAWIALEDELVGLVNQTREAGIDCGEGPVAPVGRLDPYESLTRAAREHARDMAENDFVGMTGSDGSTFQERHERCGYDGDGSQAADLATDAPLAQDALDRWLGTPTGCALVMDARFEEVGVGYYPEGIWVVAYGQP